MPNWCNNVVELYHEDVEMINRAKDAFKRGEFLNEFIPVPADLNITAGRVGADDSPEQIELEAKVKANEEKHGYATWYDFCVNEWGTKWDVGGSDAILNEDNTNALTLTFDSAWAPPINAYIVLEQLGFQVKAYYYEPGMTFCGIYEDGNDNCYDFGGMDSETVVDAVGEELDEMFGISECMAEWEEENEEELDDTPHEFNTEGKFTIEE